MYGWVTTANCGAKCNDTQVSREFTNIAASLKTPVPYQRWAAELVKKRSIEQGLDPNVHCMQRGLRESKTDDYYKRIFMAPGRVIILTERNMQYRADLPGWAAVSKGSKSDLERVFGGPLFAISWLPTV